MHILISLSPDKEWYYSSVKIKRLCLLSKYNYWKVMVKLIYIPYFGNQSFTHSNSKSWDFFSNPEELNNYSVGHSEVTDK